MYLLKTSMAILKQKKAPVKTCWSNKSLHRVFFFEVVRKCSGEISQQLPAEPTTERKTATFSAVILSKKRVIRAVYIFFTSPRIPLGLSGDLTQDKTASEGFYRGVWSGFFSKNVKNVKDFRCCVKACNSECSKWAPCCKQRPESAIYQRWKQTVTSRQWDK